MNQETVEIWICVDCAMLAANGQFPPDATPEECDRLLSLAEGSVWVGDKTHDFSRSRCDGCGSTLGGARLQAFDWILV